MVLLVAADGAELAEVKRRCGLVRRVRWGLKWAWRAELNGRVLALGADGSGGVAAAAVVRAACEHDKPEAVVSTGWCGALAPELARNQILVATRVVWAGRGKSFACALPRTSRAFGGGVLATVDRIAGTAAEKAGWRKTGAVAVDLEAAWVAEEAARRGLRFYSVRVVLDEAGESFGLDFEAARGENGRLSKTRILGAALARPARGVPELARWAWRSRQAARALGEFLAECCFET